MDRLERYRQEQERRRAPLASYQRRIAAERYAFWAEVLRRQKSVIWEEAIVRITKGSSYGSTNR